MTIVRGASNQVRGYTRARPSLAVSPPYEPRGILAVDPRAFFEMFSIPDARDNSMIGNVAIVDVRGPLRQHDDSWCDSYEAVQARVAEACESPAAIVVLRVDSPGGDAAGCFDAARAIRALARNANKLLVAYVEGKACSASYALAAAADSIILGQSGIVGSIGIISTRTDFSAMNAARGLRVALITSGERKADGNPDQPISDAELKASQELVDSMASVFFELVAELRGMDSGSVAALQAGLFHGAAAVAAGLADRVQTFDEMLAAFASGGSTPMASSYDKARAALQEAAKGDDANAAAAKRALAAMEEQDPEATEDGDKPAAGGDGDKPAAEGGDAPADDDKKDKPAETNASSDSVALQALAEVHKMRAERAAEKLTAEREKLLASRPDFSPELQAVLATAEIGTVRKMVKELPKVEAAEGGKPPKKTTTAAPPVVTATRGDGQGGPDDSPLAAVNEIDRAMGLTSLKFGCTRQGNALVFGISEVPRTAPANTPVSGGAK